MGKMIKINHRGLVEILDYPEGCRSTKPLCKEIDCDLVQEVRPKRLYSSLKISKKLDPSKPGEMVTMLVDEEGLLREKPVNLIGSWLYETDKHKNPIVGDILFVGLRDNGEEIDFCGIEDITGLALFLKLRQAVTAFKEIDKEGVFIG